MSEPEVRLIVKLVDAIRQVTPEIAPRITTIALLDSSGNPVIIVPVRSCRICGCHDADCRDCIVATGKPCSWVEPDLCSACREQGHE